MPYILPEDRLIYDASLDCMPRIHNKGDLEYCIFRLMKIFMSDREYKYSTLHDCVYATQHASDEFRRRYLDEREKMAMINNGDINE